MTRVHLPNHLSARMVDSAYPSFLQWEAHHHRLKLKTGQRSSDKRNLQGPSPKQDRPIEVGFCGPRATSAWSSLGSHSPPLRISSCAFFENRAWSLAHLPHLGQPSIYPARLFYIASALVRGVPLVPNLSASDSGSPPSPTEMSAFGSRASNVQKPGANLSRALVRKDLFHIALREDARYTLGFQTQSIGKDGEKKNTVYKTWI